MKAKKYIFFRFKKVCLILLFFPCLYKGATLSGIQRGTTTIAAGSSSATQAITAVTLSQSFLIFSIRVNDADPGDFMVGGYMSATNQLTFTRQNTGGYNRVASFYF